MIELASKREIAELRLEWEKMQTLQRTCSGVPEYAEAIKEDRQRIADDYKASEEKRIGKIAAREAARKAKRIAREKAENERWERVWKKHEDKSYYAR